MRPITLTPAIAYAAGRDAGCRSMRKAGRTAWNEDDWNAAAEVTEALLDRRQLVPVDAHAALEPEPAEEQAEGRIGELHGRRVPLAVVDLDVCLLGAVDARVDPEPLRPTAEQDQQPEEHEPAHSLAPTTPGDPDAITTPAELRRHVLAALRERVQLGDKLAEGAVRVIEHLERQANQLAGQVMP